ncbi:voltage-gated potassium channel [Aureococcus anophagefferens]|nr:voltage-gated potassium channel [Aureococcus anophagefferens]
MSSVLGQFCDINPCQNLCEAGEDLTVDSCHEEFPMADDEESAAPLVRGDEPDYADVPEELALRSGEGLLPAPALSVNVNVNVNDRSASVSVSAGVGSASSEPSSPPAVELAPLPPVPAVQFHPEAKDEHPRPTPPPSALSEEDHPSARSSQHKRRSSLQRMMSSGSPRKKMSPRGPHGPRRRARRRRRRRRPRRPARRRLPLPPGALRRHEPALLDWRLGWDIFMMVLIFFVMIVTPFELAYVSGGPFKSNFDRDTFRKGYVIPNKHTGLWFSNMIVNFGFIIDISFNFSTAVYDEKRNEWVLSYGGIAWLYAKSWLLLDVGSILPLEYFFAEAKIVRLLRLFRLFKLAKVLKSQKLVGNVAKHVDMSTKMQTIITYCIFLLFMIHWSACALRLTVLTETGNWGEGIWAVYVEACIWALIALNGEADTITHAECVLGLIIMLMGVIILAFLIGDMSNIMSNLDPVANEFKQTLDNLNDYMAKSGFPNALRLKLREYIMLSEPVYRDHFNKDMLSKLSPSLIAIVARQNLGRVVNRIPFYAYTIQPDDDPPPPVIKEGVVTGLPALLRYDVAYADGTSEQNVKFTRIMQMQDRETKLTLYKLNFQRDLFVAKVAHLFTTQLFMTFDKVIHQDLDQNDKAYGICLKQDNEFFGDDIAMLACGDRQKKLRHYSAHATAVTQLHALNSDEFLELLDSNVALSLFAHHFRVWGCWQRLKRCFAGGREESTRLCKAIKDAEADIEEEEREKHPSLFDTSEPAALEATDTAALLALVSDASLHGLAEYSVAPREHGARSPHASPEALAHLRKLVAALRAA